MTVDRINKINRVLQDNTSKAKIDEQKRNISFSQFLSQSADIKISKHASQRLQTQNINIDQRTLIKLQEAVDKASQKGLKNDVLIMDGDTVYVVNVKNRVVVTVKNMNNLKENIFTNIEGVLML